MTFLHLSLLDWFWLVLAGLGLLICFGLFGLFVWRMSRIPTPTTSQGRFHQALLGGALTAGVLISFLISLLAIGYILDKQAKWSLGDFLIIVLCLVLPFQVIATIGIYWRFLIEDWMQRQLRRLAERQHKDNSR